MNKIILCGRTGAEVHVHHFDGGNCVGKVSLATSRKWKDKESGETKEATEWHALIFRNKAAEVVAKYAGKGSQLLVDGEVRYRKFQKEDGSAQYFTEVHVQNFTFLDTKDPGESTGETERSRAQDKEDPEDDLPF